MNEDVLAANLANWESRVPVHVTGYGLERFLEDLSHLSDVVSYDAPALGDLTGRRVAHLQCHIGTDTISLARLGADVVGLDFSPSAVEVARDLADRAGNVARFVQADVYDAPRSDPLVPVLDLTVEATNLETAAEAVFAIANSWPDQLLCNPRYAPEVAAYRAAGCPHCRPARSSSSLSVGDVLCIRAGDGSETWWACAWTGFDRLAVLPTAFRADR